VSAVITAGRGGRVAGRRRRGSRLIGACFAVVVLVVVMAALGSLIAPHDPNAQNPLQALARPSAAHWLGTDSLGRDVFSRLIAGARTAFIGPLVIAASSMLLGNLLGLLAGYRGGRVDAVIMRWVDLMWAVPGLRVIIVVARQQLLAGGDAAHRAHGPVRHPRGARGRA
jgi:peptide/nickel transport system permease protein